MKAIFLTLILISVAFSGFAQKTDVETLSKSAGGKRVLSYEKVGTRIRDWTKQIKE